MSITPPPPSALADVAAARPGPPGDADLVQAVLAGDASAFEMLMRRHNRLMFRVARGIVDSDADAQDVVQEAWMRAFTAIASWRGEAALTTWLVRIAMHAAWTLLRQRGRSITMSDLPDDGALDTLSTGDEDPRPDPAQAGAAGSPPTPEGEAHRAQMARLLTRAVNTLPPIYRSVFMLRAVQELSVDDTAAALQVSADVVKTRYLRARALLRQCLQHDTGLPPRELYAFDGARCDAVVHHVLAQLRQCGVIRDH